MSANLAPIISRESEGTGCRSSTITTHDLYELLRLTVQGVLAWTLPEAAWRPLSRLFVQVSTTTHGSETAQVAAVLAGTPMASSVHRIIMENRTHRAEQRFQYLRAWRPGGWTPTIDVIGAERVSAALAQGRGIIFLSGNFSFNNLVTKMAWHRLGLAVSQFSRPVHGFSSTRFGVRYLNAICRRIEDRYLGQRLMTEEHETSAVLQRMREYLKANGVVAFAVGNQGRRTESAVFLGGRISLATGPLAMGRAVGAVALPTYTIRLGPRRFEVTIGTPIEAPLNKDGNVDYAAAVQAYADALTPFVLRDPGQWCGWCYTASADSPEP